MAGLYSSISEILKASIHKVLQSAGEKKRKKMPRPIQVSRPEADFLIGSLFRQASTGTWRCMIHSWRRPGPSSLQQDTCDASILVPKISRQAGSNRRTAPAAGV